MDQLFDDFMNEDSCILKVGQEQFTFAIQTYTIYLYYLYMSSSFPLQLYIVTD